MNRNTALKIERADWMDESLFDEVIDFYGIEATAGIDEETGKPVIWLEYHDENIFQLAIGEMNIISGLSLWWDSGDSEIHITEHNYEAYPEEEFYKERTGTYDIHMDEY